MATYSEWGRKYFHRYSQAVAFVEVTDNKGDKHVGTAFHVGNGVFVTARHVVEEMAITGIGVDKGIDPFKFGEQASYTEYKLLAGPFLHNDSTVDIACFTVSNPPEAELPLGGHLDVYLRGHELLLHRVLLLGYPPVPLTKQTNLIACLGEINGLIETMHGQHPSFLISTTARGGFSGGPVLIAYNEDDFMSGTAVLGIVTESLIFDGKAEESGYMAISSVQPIYDCLNQHSLLPESQRYE